MEFGKTIKRGIGAGVGMEAAKLLESAYKSNDVLDRLGKSVVGGAMANVAYKLIAPEKKDSDHYKGWSTPS